MSVATKTRELVKLATSYQSFVDDHDTYLLAYDREKGKIVSELVDSTRFAMGGERDWTEVAATADDIAAVRELARERLIENLIDRAEARLEKLERGKTVEVVRGRKVPIGTTGTIGWIGESRYGGYRLGIDTAEGERVWTAAGNVEVVTDEGGLTEAEAARIAAERVEATDDLRLLASIWKKEAV